MDSKTGAEGTFTSRVFIAIAAAVFTILLLVLIYFTFDVLLLIFAAALMAIFLRGLADVLGVVLKISEGWRVAIVSLLMIVVIAAAVALLAPSVAEQIVNLREELPRSAAAASEFLARFAWGRTLLDQLPSFSEVLGRINAATLLTGVGGVFSSTVGAVGDFFIAILLAIYFAAEPNLYLSGFLRLFPVNRRHRWHEILDAVGQTLRWWLIGKAGSMLFIGLLTWLGLTILGVPLAVTLGLIAGLLSFIPNIGPILSAIPALLIAFVDSPTTALYVAILFVLVQLIESNVVTPLIERRTVELPPALTIIFQLALAVLVGGLGLVLATPLLAMILVLVQMVYIADVLQEGESPDSDLADEI